MRTLIYGTMALALAGVLVLPQKGAGLGFQPDTPYGLFGEQSGSYLGIDTRDITHERMVSLKLKEERGVEVTAGPPKAGVRQTPLRAQVVIGRTARELVEPVRHR